MQQTKLNGYRDFLKKLIEQKLYESFNAANIPKSFYDHILKNMDIDKVMKKFYGRVAEKLKEKANNLPGDCIILRKEADDMLGRCYNVPRKVRYYLLCELKDQGYIKEIGKRRVFLNKEL